jgi:phosphoserine phosphatase RsbU/P
MSLSYRYMRLRLSQAGFLPAGKLALIAWYLLALDVMLFLLQKLFALLKLSFGQSLGGWVSFLSFVVIVLFGIVFVRWAKARMLWRLRNRLIVTYIFIGVIPVVLLVTLTLGSFYLFTAQFATYIVTTSLQSELQSLEAANSALAHELSAQIQRGSATEVAALEGLRKSNPVWADRQVCAWLDGKLLLNSPPRRNMSAPALPAYLKQSFRDVVRDHGQLYLRAAETVAVQGKTLTVLASEPLDQHLLQRLAVNLGEIALYTTGLTLHKTNPAPASGIAATNPSNARPGTAITVPKPESGYVLETQRGQQPTYTAGMVPSAGGRFDRQVTFPTTVTVVNWETGDTANPAAFSVQTRLSKLYERLFASLGDFAPAVEFFLLAVAIVFGIIELIALIIGIRLNRTVTSAVAQLYDATRHINRGDFSHRIPVKSNDQLATLANSFNLMTASLEKLIDEQKQKQRMENELAIAQEVQAQLFPREIAQLPTLELYGFCRPARTVSGDYYDFLNLDSGRLLLAVGDISGKGISAALLMATIHSAVRAYSMEGIPILSEPVAVGAGLGSSAVLDSVVRGPEISSATLLSLLNYQLYRSTPAEKYATLFVATYDAQQRALTYSNGGHLPPLILGGNGSLRRLDHGGTVVGLFDQTTYEESSIPLNRGEIFLAYSDGVTEPENDFGEFGEQRLVDLVLENRDLPLARISEIVISAVLDWIGAAEQPDDITVVLARAR